MRGAAGSSRGGRVPGTKSSWMTEASEGRGTVLPGGRGSGDGFRSQGSGCPISPCREISPVRFWVVTGSSCPRQVFSCGKDVVT